MYVKVRTMDGTQTAVLNVGSKLTSIENLRILVQDKFDVLPERQRLFYRGKQMEDGHRIFDYNVNINDVIQLMIKPVLNELPNQAKDKTVKSKPSSKNLEVCNKENVSESKPDEPSTSSSCSQFYKEDDLVDAKCLYDGTWWEGRITRMVINTKCTKKTKLDDGLLYYVKYERYADVPEDELKLEHIRPRAKTKREFVKIKRGEIVMVNYNFENPEERGFWYDCEVTKIINTRTEKTVIGTLRGKIPIEGCHITLVDEIFKIEKHIPLADRNERNLQNGDAPVERKSGFICSTCKDNPRRNCTKCGCCKCGGKESPEKQLMCDECDQPYHIFCLDPPLDAIPDVEEWFCPECKNDETEIVRAGEKLKDSKKKANLASSKSKSKRDWGKGFACAGRQKVCTIVPHDHFGPVPGVEVGTLWKFRLQASEAGVHRPHVAGIHGRENHGAYSIVLAGGYEDDEDRGDEFTYTGSGGRDLSGNKRTAEQSCDQLLTRMNKALALNCNTPLQKDGAEAVDWKKGKPVRVVRNWKGSKHSKYAPKDGNRYDGIYKVAKYWQASGKSGFKVWRYLFKRDDSSPPPWSEEGKKRSKELGLKMQFPEGYLEAMKEKDNEFASNVSSGEEEEESPKRKGRKRKQTSDEEDEDDHNPASKKIKTTSYMLENELSKSISKDKANAKLWQECKAVVDQGKATFTSTVEERFSCICCQILVNTPVTTPCKHNVCQECLQRSFKAEIYTCPSCRHDLGRNYKMTINKPLKEALLFLFPGYDAGR